MILDFLNIPTGLAAGVGISTLLIGVAISFVVYKLLKRVMRMAFRMAIVSVIMVIAILVCSFFFLLGFNPSERPPRRNVPASTR